MVERSGPTDDGGMTTTNNKQIVEEFITALFTDGDLTASTAISTQTSSTMTRRCPAPRMGRKACVKQPSTSATPFLTGGATYST